MLADSRYRSGRYTPPIQRPSVPMRLAVTTGAPIGVSLGEDWPSVRTYGDRINYYAEALDKDAKAQLIWEDPANVKALLDKAKANTGPGALAVPTLQAEYDLLTARVKARGGDAQIPRDIAWTQKWSAWFAQWVPWNDAIHSVSPAGFFSTKTLTTAQAWDTQQTYEFQLRDFYATFAALGATPSYTLPATLVTPTGQPEEKWSIPSELIWIGGAIAIASVVNAVRR